MRVLYSTVSSSTLRQLSSDGMRAITCATCFGSYCGDLSLKIFSQFQITASALNGAPSWKRTPWRSLMVHLVLSAGSTVHEVARPGRMPATLVAEDRSQFTSAS